MKQNIKEKLTIFWLCDTLSTQPQTFGKFDAFSGNATPSAVTKMPGKNVILSHCLYYFLELKIHLKLLW